MTGVAAPRLYAPPPDSNDPREPPTGIGAWRFPEWFVVQEEAAVASASGRAGSSIARRSTRRAGSTAAPVVATRFVRACPRGHVDDLDW